MTNALTTKPSSLEKLSQTDFIAEAEKLGHTVKIIGVTMNDQVVCACGWKSEVFFDGAEYAMFDWRKHVTAVSGDGQQTLNF